MGYLVDRLAVLFDSLQQVQARLISANRISEAMDMQQQVLDPLVAVSIEIDGSPVDTEDDTAAEPVVETEGREEVRAGSTRLSWSCCHSATRTKTRSGKTVWVASCRWKQGRRSGMQTRRVSRGQSEPKHIRLSGRTVKGCR